MSVELYVVHPAVALHGIIQGAVVVGNLNGIGVAKFVDGNPAPIPRRARKSALDVERNRLRVVTVLGKSCPTAPRQNMPMTQSLVSVRM